MALCCDDVFVPKGEACVEVGTMAAGMVAELAAYGGHAVGQSELEVSVLLVTAQP